MKAFFVITLLLVVLPAFVFAATTVTISDITKAPGITLGAEGDIGDVDDAISLPVMVTQDAGETASSFDINISFDNSKLSFLEVQMGNTITKAKSWSMSRTNPSDANSSGSLSIDLAAPNAAGKLADDQDGIVAFLLFRINGLRVRDNTTTLYVSGAYDTTNFADDTALVTGSFVLGNVTGDGAVTALDAYIAMQASVGNLTLPDWALWSLMVTDDHQLTAADAYAILDNIANSTAFPISTSTTYSAPSLVAGSTQFRILQIREVYGSELTFEARLEGVLESKVVAGQINLAMDPLAYDVEIMPLDQVKKNLIWRYGQGSGKLPFFRKGSDELSGELFKIRFKMPIGSDIKDPIRIAKAQLNEQGVGVDNLSFQRSALENSALLANYPNPFNPETWMPYRLGVQADVAIRIYDSKGNIVRQLKLGRQAPGFYVNKSRAAYWDGRSDVGERVSSGVYFYTLRAGDFSQTRKMIILK